MIYVLFLQRVINSKTLKYLHLTSSLLVYAYVTVSSQFFYTRIMYDTLYSGTMCSQLSYPARSQTDMWSYVRRRLDKGGLTII